MSAFIGKSLGRDQILEQLGEGGTTTDGKAYDPHLEVAVAVKIIRTENLPQSGVERALKRFEREARALAKRTHAKDIRQHGGKHSWSGPGCREHQPGDGSDQDLACGHGRAWQYALILP
ncbi:MAG: hypothetical protein JXB85_05680 [Anaerolineales bacterium]|nr:hypothetical protein [Anaerolineales bacterium]